VSKNDCMKHFLLSISLLLVLNSFAAKGPKPRLFVVDGLHNSYKEVRENKPYEITAFDSLNLLGYFDAVYDTTFLFVTEDSVYVLNPKYVTNIFRISSFNENRRYLNSNGVLKTVAGVVLSTVGGFTFLVSGISMLVEPTGIGTAIFLGSGAVLTSGIVLANKKADSRNSNKPLLMNGQPRYRLRIIKS
jgi:hypothetical protein